MQTTLLNALTTIGSIAETNSSYFHFFESQLKKPIDELTVAELLAIHSECKHKYNEVMK